MANVSSSKDPYPSSEDHLRDELVRVAGFVRAQLLRFRSAVPEAQRERYWHVSDDYLESLAGDDTHSPLDVFEPAAGVREILRWTTHCRAAIDHRVLSSHNVELRLLRLTREFHLSHGDADALLLTLLPHMHSSYRRLYGLLQHEGAKTSPSVSLLAEMLSTNAAEFVATVKAFGPGSALVSQRLVALGGSDDEPLVCRPVVLDDRVCAFLFGQDQLDARLAPVARRMQDIVDVRSLPLTVETANRLEMLPCLRAAEPELLPRLRIEFSGPDPGLAVGAAQALANGFERSLLVVDVRAALAAVTSWPILVDSALREARLLEALPLFAGVDALQEEGVGHGRLDLLLTRLASFPHPAAIEVGSATIWSHSGNTHWIPFALGAPTIEMRERSWLRLFDSQATPPRGHQQGARDLAAAFQLTETQIRDAWRNAESLARRRNVFIATVSLDDVFDACRKQSTRRLVAFAQRIEPRRGLSLDHVVLPTANKQQLSELRARIHNQGRLQQTLGGQRMRLGRGITALFVGGSGTGKTMAAEVLASEQRVDLYRVDLSALVSKWVGETEKNLSRIFADAERANCMLFFDEADAMFGQRREIKEAQDRWANLEVNYLLQRIEDFSGVVILATNLRQNIDEAFQRRIHVVVDFPMPDAESRREIWQRMLPEQAGCAISASELDEVASRFELAGGNIGNIVLDACYRMLDAREPQLTMRHVIAGTAREYQKILRPVTRGEFGQQFYEWAMGDVISPAAPAPGA